eukprot:maker-scaffold_49-snap-gene-1.97-mRNA-1 protein AED:0.04 eAED:0.04 QI:106/1/1/1/0.5/0.33/3/305/202
MYKGLKSFRQVNLQSYTLFLCSGSVVDFSGDAVVNAANEHGLGGGGLDGAMNSRGGKALQDARRNLPIIIPPSVRIPTGQARITIGGNLPAKFCIHAVGPMFFADYKENPDALLKSAYKSCLEILEHHKDAEINSLAFCLLSAGIFKGEKSLLSVLSLGLEAIREFDGANSPREKKKELFVVAFTDTEIEKLEEAGNKVFPQ